MTEKTQSYSPFATNVSADMIDSTLKQFSAGAMSLEKILAQGKALKLAQDEANKMRDQVVQLTKALKAKAPSTGGAVIASDMPDYTIEMKKIKDVFSFIDGLLAEMEVPVFEWAEYNPYVPHYIPHFEPDKDIINGILKGLVMNDNTWIYGETGCGKDASIHYVANALNMPVVTISFDADISRADLIGRDKLKSDGKGGTESELTEGVLPFGMRHPCFLVLDEIDFIREDVAYVMQTMLNEGRLVMLEDGGKIIELHEHCRIVATANTNGMLDERANYNGARQQSAAFLDRFTNWVRATYLNDYSRLLSMLSGYSITDLHKVNEFIKSYQKSFIEQDIQTPLSNRAIVTIGEQMSALKNDTVTCNVLFKKLFDNTVGNRLLEFDRARIDELMHKHLGV